MTAPQVLTIGHSTHSLDEFVSLLQRNDVTALADVRSMPFSRFMPHFNRRELRRALVERDLSYAFLGRELGARSEDQSCYVEGRVQYRLLARTELFRTGIDRVLKGAATERIALMCAEKDPLDCHRTLLVARALVEEGIDVGHILHDGRLEGHVDAMTRLMEKFGLMQASLFRSPDELVEEAISRQEHRIAYVDSNLVTAAAESAGP
jgi:uncharacterized protein (DUF488 family)